MIWLRKNEMGDGPPRMNPTTATTIIVALIVV
jgi:hypothetical protein